MIVGIDSAKNRVDAVALLDGRYLEHFTADFEGVRELGYTRSQVLQGMRRLTDDWLQHLAMDYHVPGEEITVFVEEPIVMRSARTAVLLAETVGMLLALPHRVYSVPIDSWKQVAVGKGGVGKAVVREAIIRRLPQTEQLFGKRQDLFDATGVALYGDSVLRRL